jgi:glycine/D-amino acid oxidase-like deaminating enzyme
MQHDQAHRTSIAIVGGGIGGLTAACLLRAGFDVHVYEQTSKFSEVGAVRRAFCIGWELPKNLKKPALSRRASISGAGMTGAFCSALR